MLSLFLLRLHLLILALLAGLLIGDTPAKLCQFPRITAWFDGRIARVTTKLNRPGRSIATRLWRGLIVLPMFLLPMLAAGLVLQQLPYGALLILALLFGQAYASWELLRLWRQATHEGVKLELPGLAHLFADSHGVLRYYVLARGEAFAIGVVGSGFWYLVAGLPGLLLYLMIARLAGALAHLPVFGWGATSLFALADALPRLLSCLLLALGGVFVPGAKPWTVFGARRFHGFLARLLDVALGGTVAERELPWEGTGTPKLLPEHLARFGLIRLAATVLLLLALATPEWLNLLKDLKS